MNLNRIAQAILLMLAVVGLFAAMARNAYGFNLLAVSCFGLAVLFLFQLLWTAISEFGSLTRATLLEGGELLLLTALTSMFGLRVLYLYMPNSEDVFNGICLLQVLTYAGIGYSQTALVRKANRALSTQLVFLYSSLLLFLLSILFRSNASLSFGLGVLATVVSLPFVVSVIRRKSFELGSKSVTLLQHVVAARNKAGLMFLFFVSSALFTGLAYFGIVPGIQDTDLPKDYIELINEAESGRETPVEGRYHHELYREAMERFSQRHGNSPAP
jgi:hypothetical protein